jgi:hypothetical protein
MRNIFVFLVYSQEIEGFAEELLDIIVRQQYREYYFLSRKKQLCFTIKNENIHTFESGYLTISSSILICTSDNGIYKC